MKLPMQHVIFSLKLEQRTRMNLSQFQLSVSSPLNVFVCPELPLQQLRQAVLTPKHALPRRHHEVTWIRRHRGRHRVGGDAGEVGPAHEGG